MDCPAIFDTSCLCHPALKPIIDKALSRVISSQHQPPRVSLEWSYKDVQHDILWIHPRLVATYDPFINSPILFIIILRNLLLNMNGRISPEPLARSWSSESRESPGENEQQNSLSHIDRRILEAGKLEHRLTTDSARRALQVCHRTSAKQTTATLPPFTFFPHLHRSPPPLLPSIHPPGCRGNSRHWKPYTH